MGRIVALMVVDCPPPSFAAPLMVSDLTVFCTLTVNFARTPVPSVAVAVIVTVPALSAVTTPFASTVAMRLLLVDQVTLCAASSGKTRAVS